jgi:N-6 DNA Methylase
MSMVTKLLADSLWSQEMRAEPDQERKRARGEVFTPRRLVCEMLDRLPVHVWSNPGLRWFDPAAGLGQFPLEVYTRLRAHHTHEHIVRNMLFMSEIDDRNARKCRQLFGADANVYHGDTLAAANQGGWPHAFHIVVGNPPFNTGSLAKRNKSNQLWRLFVERALDSWVLPGGYLSFVHPPGWRVPGDSLLERLKSLHVLYLSLQNDAAGKAVFGCTVRYDWYVVRSAPATGACIVRDDAGVEASVDLRDVAFIPNSNFDAVRRLVGLTSEPRCEILWKNVYRSDNCVMKPTAEYNKTVVYTVVQPTAQVKNEHGRDILRGSHGVALVQYGQGDSTVYFDVPKVIFRRTDPHGSLSDPAGTLALALPPSLRNTRRSSRGSRRTATSFKRWPLPAKT